MAKYAKYQRREIEKPRDVHPIWRGIGCLLMIITPLMAYALGRLLLTAAFQRSVPLPPEILERITFDDWVYTVPVLSSICRFIARIPYPWAQAIFFFIALVALSALVSTVYGFVYSAIGPPRYTPLDAPPPKRRAREYKR